MLWSSCSDLARRLDVSGSRPLEISARPTATRPRLTPQDHHRQLRHRGPPGIPNLFPGTVHHHHTVDSLQTSSFLQTPTPVQRHPAESPPRTPWRRLHLCYSRLNEHLCSLTHDLITVLRLRTVSRRPVGFPRSGTRDTTLYISQAIETHRRRLILVVINPAVYSQRASRSTCRRRCHSSGRPCLAVREAKVVTGRLD